MPWHFSEGFRVIFLLIFVVDFFFLLTRFFLHDTCIIYRNSKRKEKIGIIGSEKETFLYIFM